MLKTRSGLHSAILTCYTINLDVHSSAISKVMRNKPPTITHYLVLCTYTFNAPTVVSKVLPVVGCSVVNKLKRVWRQVGQLPASCTEAAILIHAQVGRVRQPVFSYQCTFIHQTVKVRKHLQEQSQMWVRSVVLSLPLWYTLELDC